MPVTVRGTAVELVGAVTVEDAEPLAAFLRSTPAARVGVRRLTALHTAALQALLAARPEVRGVPADPFLAAHVLPLLAPAVAPDPVPTPEPSAGSAP